jgi:hypothetical protein
LDRRNQFAKAIYLMDNGFKKMSDFPLIIPSSNYLPSLPATVLDYLNLSFFKSGVGRLFF